MGEGTSVSIKLTRRKGVSSIVGGCLGRKSNTFALNVSDACEVPAL